MSIRNMLYPAGGRPKSAVSEFHVQIRDKLEVALRYVYQAPIMPVVSRADCRKLGGFCPGAPWKGTAQPCRKEPNQHVIPNPALSR